MVVCIVDDGSTSQETLQFYETLQSYNFQSVLIRHPGNANKGVAASLNFGINHILKTLDKCKYIFRFDSDDICLPERI